MRQRAKVARGWPWGMALLVLVAVTLTETRAAAEDAPPQSCRDCHGQGADKDKAGLPPALLDRSAHSVLECTDCHASLSLDGLDPAAEKPHGEEVEPVNCGGCHEEAAEVYQRHGRLQVGKDPDLPQCWSCHGAHDILSSSERQSHTHPMNLPDACRACHVEINLVEKHQLRDARIRLYENSVHGQASKRGLYVSATCNDCHSATDPDGERTAHRILAANDPDSTIYHFKIPDTCGRCHKAVTKDYWDGIHGQLVKRGEVDAPVCTYCHGEHGIISPSDPRSPVSAARVAEATCAPCHESAVLNEKYGIPAGRLRSYVDSYHGLKSKAGDVRVANCASCHGAHRILPHTDAASSIHPSNLRNTCGECHPGISADLAGTPIHETATGIRTGWPAFFRLFYLWFIGATIGLMLLHNVADLVRHIKITGRKPYVLRMTPNETFQHWLLTISFIVLMISGFSLRFSEAWWVKLLFGWGGGEGFLFRGLVHRIAAVAFGFCCLWHLCYLCTQRGRHALRDMILARRDFADLRDNALFFIGAREERPRFGRFTYVEKCEYWAVLWGALIMSVTGTLLWFDNYVVEQWELPKGILDVALVIHYYEAWLASLAVFVWHGYSVILSPHVYPTNPAWISGRMPKDMYTREHPEGPRLKARMHRVPAEEDEEDSPRPSRASKRGHHPG